MIFKQDISEEYPSDFNMEEFKNLKSYNARLKYASEKLKRIGSGSARVVFKIDDEKVLKVAKNTKGIAQNEKEASYSNDYYIENIIATTFDYHPDFQWIEMEFAQKLTPKKFKEATGVDINELDNYLKYEHHRITSNKPNMFSVTPEFEEKVQDNEFVSEIVDYMGNYGIPPGDLGVISSYGIVKRNGEDRVVLIDYGLDDNIYKQHYLKEGYSKIKKIVRECVDEVLLKEKEKIYSGREVNRYIKDITPEESDIPSYFMDKFIAPRKFKVQKVNIDDLLKSDPSFKEYYDSEIDRYEDEEYMDHNNLYNYVTIVDGEVMDGYNRMSVLKRGGNDFVDAYVALPKK